MRPTHYLLPLALLTSSIGASVSLAGTGFLYSVDRTDDNSAASTCSLIVPNDCSLRGAIRAANQNGGPTIVVVPDGHYQLIIPGPSEDSALTGDLDITLDDLSIRAASGAHPVIEQVTQDRILHIGSSAGNVELVGPLTLLGGDVTNSDGLEQGGSMLFNRADSLTLAEVHMIGGFATGSGGCLSWLPPVSSPGALNLTDVTFAHCATEDSGGAFAIQNLDSPVSLDRVSVQHNTAGAVGGGGAILGGSAPVSIVGSTFEHNTAALSSVDISRGGALFLGSGSFTIFKSAFASNIAGRTGGLAASGGGIHSQTSQVLLRNSTFSENRALAPSSHGADLHVSGGSDIDLQFVTVKALEPVSLESIQVLPSSTLDILASVIEGTCSGNGGINSLGFNIELPPGGAMSTQCDLNHATDLLIASTLLKPLAGYGGPTPTHALRPATAGTALHVPSTTCLSTDQRRAPRTGSLCYSGAYEEGAPAPGSWIFDDGFESGNTAAWSASAP